MNSTWRTNNRMRLFLALPLLLASCVLLNGQTEQKKRDLKYEKDEPIRETPSVSIPRGYAVVIGVAKYRNLTQQQQLDFPESDAELMYSILISPEGGNFKAENVHRLIGPRATLANVRRELEEWLPSVAKPDDRVLIYFAGHGFVAGGKGYLAMYDLDPANVAGTGYSMETLGSVIGSKVQAKWKVLLTDSCHSGSITPEADRQKLNNDLKGLQPSIFSLTASRDREQSFESPQLLGGHGVFTYFVYKGLEGSADESHDGIINADELAEYVHREVRAYTAGRQNPTSERGSFDKDMLLAYVPPNAQAAKLPAAKTGTLVFETNMDGVELIVDGNTVSTLTKGQPFKMPGLVPGLHTIKAVKLDYEPYGPREEIVTPGGESTVSIKITTLRRRKKAALDEFDKGLEEYNKGTLDHYKKAAAHFKSALDQEPTFSKAALFLGRSYNLLSEQEKAKEYYKRAVDIDPEYLEARATYGGMLLDLGDDDEAIRQLDFVVRRDKTNKIAFANLAAAQKYKSLFADSISSAHEAIELDPNYAEPHFWLAESLRLSEKHELAAREYKEYLRLSNFDNGAAGKANYYILGYMIGFGRKKRANLTDVWKEMRASAYFGLCDSERNLKHLDEAISYCQRAVNYDRTDPFVHYALAMAYTRVAEISGTPESLPAARSHFEEMLRIAPGFDDADKVRRYIHRIDTVLQANQ